MSFVRSRKELKVALFDINDVQGEKVAREIRETGGECEAIKVNLTLEEDVKKRQSILSKKIVGTPSILVNSAGLYRKGRYFIFYQR